MQYNNLQNWYTNVFQFVQMNKMFSLFEYESLHPFEVEIYNIMLADQEKQKTDMQKTQASLQRALQERGY